MTNLKFEGNIDGVRPRQLEYIGSVLEDFGYKNEKVLMEAVGKPGDNFIASLKRIIVEKNGETFKMIVKLAPEAEKHRAMMRAELAFRNEHIMYTEVLPKFVELQQTAGVPENERLRYAACYGSLSEPPNEVILLEDLAVSDFTTLNRLNTLTDESVKFALKNFAILHSSAYATKKLEPETYEAFKVKLTDMSGLTERIDDKKIYFDMLEKDILTVVDEKYGIYFKGAILDIATQANKLFKADKDSKYSIIQHGDAWSNNIMFRIKDEIAVECCMIDYQLSKESMPVNDILYMIFNCTDYGTRAKHYKDWIDYYHTELDKYLSFYGLKANNIYSKDKLEADLKRYGKLYFGAACLMSSMIIKEGAEAAQMKEDMDNQGISAMFNKVSGLDKNTVLRFKERLEGLLNSFLELGYLK